MQWVFRIEPAVEVVEHQVGVQNCAAVEGHIGAQVKHIIQLVVRDQPVQRQGWHRVAGCVQPHQPVINVITDHQRIRVCGDGRIELDVG